MSYSVPESNHQVIEVVKGSRFISRVFNCSTVAAAKQQLKLMRVEEPDATHHCWAYIIGDPKSTTLVGCSDDGEPAGTAGKPMLNVLQHSDIGDILVVCTRYYGGTKLGTGGLARAYGGGAKLALEELPLVEKVDWCHFSITVDYAKAKDLEHEIKQLDGRVEDIQYDAKVTMLGKIAQAEKTKLKQIIAIKFEEQVTWTSI